MEENKKTAIIIGAGPAGLTAAYRLLKETDITPVIFEAEAFVGGISRTAEHNGNRMDIGGHRFFSKNKEVMKLWQDIEPVQGSPSYDDKLLNRNINLMPGGPDPEKEERVLLVRNRISRIFYLKKFFDYPISMKPQTFINMGLVNTIKAGAGYVWSLCFKKKEENLEDFMINRFGITLYRMFFCNYTEKVWGRHPKDISAEWGAQRIKGLSLMKTLANAIKKAFKAENKSVETSLIENFYYPKKGPGQLWEFLKQEIEDLGGIIHLESEIIALKKEGNQIKSVTIRKNGKEETVCADLFLSSMPVCDLISGMGEAVHDEEVKKTAKELPYRDFITVGLLLDKLKIKNNSKIKTLGNIIPDCWIYVQEDSVKMGRIQIFNNWSPYMLSDPRHTLWIGLEYFCNEGDKLWNMNDKDFINMAIDELVQIGMADAKDVKDSVRIKVKKAYPAYFGAYENFSKVQAYLNNIENLYCIGRNGQHRYNNMDHSMLTAMEAVRAIRGLCSKDSVWNVNTEKEYHESGKKGE
ncbi:MAG: NAD(P)/FAD-dependent oxidoreductase [Lachnospiraceae bacterium]|nr:NAD(P)/FAD-dependent oxidoreductase [Lachnospiraceae bacterium]